jgi:putative membrane protein
MGITWKRGLLTASAALFVALTGPATAQEKTEAAAAGGASKMSSAKSSADTKFAREAAVGGMAEVALGKVAISKASNDAVKQFGQRMIDDHGKAGDELKSIAAKHNLAIPDELDAKHKAMVDKYSGMSGAAFDRAYMRDMVQDHEQDIAEFQKEANSGSNADLKNWAGTTLPTLQEHLRKAKEAQNALETSSRK